MLKLLLLSNSTLPATPFFSWAEPYVQTFLVNSGISRLLFIPHAAVTFSFDDYSTLVETTFARWGCTVESLHRESNKRQAVEKAEAVLVGGGNTFALLKRLYDEDLLALMRDKVRWGTPYIGWSAGANLACPTIMTTNDMPIVHPPSLQGLGLIPFQLNPHYTEFKQEGHGGETRRQRLEEFLTMNPRLPVLGLPEGMLLERAENKLMLKGQGMAKWFVSAAEPEAFPAGADVSALLNGSE